MLYLSRFLKGSRSAAPIGHRVIHKTLISGRKQKSPLLLLPPFVTPQELRIMLQIDYPTCLRECGVRTVGKMYLWEDHLKRKFEMINKREVAVPFEIAARVCHRFGFTPKMIDPEPEWKFPVAESPAHVPVVAILGHMNHGKTTTLDWLAGSRECDNEPGKITQNINGYTIWLRRPTQFDEGADTSYNNGMNECNLPPFRMTVLDTPGHEIFDVLRGRAAYLADIALVILSVENEVELQTEEVVMQADKFGIPVVFALNKIDSFLANPTLTKAELIKRCRMLFEEKKLSRPYTEEISNCLPISALYGTGMDDLKKRLIEVASSRKLPSNPVLSLNTTANAGYHYRLYKRRSDMLMGLENGPSSIGIVADIVKTASKGTVLNVIVRHGTITSGSYFTVGSSFGQITKIYDSEGASQEEAIQGTIVTICGITKGSGEPTVDDIFMVLPKERAFRLAMYRQRVEKVVGAQIDGPPLQTSWESDSPLLHQNAQATDAYKSRSKTLKKRSSDAFDGNNAKMHSSLTVKEHAENEIDEADVEVRRPTEDADISTYLKIVNHPDSLESILIPPLETIGNSMQYKVERQEGDNVDGSLDIMEIDDELNSPSLNTSAIVPDKETAGRRIRRSTIDNDGKNKESTDNGLNEPWYYYKDRESWEVDIDRKNKRLMDRWRDKTKQKELKKKEEEYNRRSLELYSEKLRRKTFGEAPLSEEEEQAYYNNALGESSQDQPETADEVAHPPKLSPVVPIILRATHVGLFDTFLNGLEQIEEEYNMRLPVVHGGIGPITQTDIIHAEIEAKYSHCPVYAFQVAILPEAVQQAVGRKIIVKQYDVFTELLSDIRERCERIQTIQTQKTYFKSLQHQPTRSGL